MKIPWKRVLTGLRIAFGIAVKLNDAHIITVKGLDKVSTVKDIIEAEVAAVKPAAPVLVQPTVL